MWQYYPGQGIEIQWLGTFGEANGYYLSGHENANLRQLLNEVIPLATNRAGGIAWEYMFRFDGGAPPWTSGLSQGTALQALARALLAASRSAYLSAAQQALGIFETRPPVGRAGQDTPAGSLYAEYTYAPPSDPQRLHPGARRPLRLHLAHQRPARRGAVRSRRRRGARRGAALRHRGVVAV